MTSRQKSCYGCVRAKRKCDKRLPKCRRCIARRIDCEYTEKTCTHAAESAGIDREPELAVAEFMTRSPQLDNLQLQQSSQFSSFGPLIPDPLSQLGLSPFYLPSLPGDELLTSAVLEDIMIDQNPVDSRVISSAWYQPRVEFVAKRMAEIPRWFAERAQTMFIHRCLLQMQNPQPLQDAMSICALYCMKTPDNQTIVFGNLENKVRQLIGGMDLLHVSRSELLVAVQTLLLYQIIRLFDGDIRLRAQAEADEITFLTWTSELKSRMQTIEPSSSPCAEALYTTEASLSDWMRWLFEESIRRTVFTATMVKALYEFLKYGFEDVPEDGLCFTAQAALWNAQSEYSWRTACYERERLEIRASNWNHDVARATPDDLEELGVLAMASIWGLESSAEWLGKNYIARYGLE